MTGITLRARLTASSVTLLVAGLAALLILGSPVNAQGNDPGNVPGAPDKPAGTAIYSGMVDLEWNDVPGAASYDVQAFKNDWFDLPGNGIEIAFWGPGAAVRGLQPGSRYYFRVRATNSLGSSEWSEFLFMPPTGGDFRNWDGVPEPTNSPATGAPTVSGTAQVGETLTADISDIKDENGLERVKFHYQWFGSDEVIETEIVGATQAQYTVFPADLGKAIKVRVSFIDRGGFAESRTGASPPVMAAPETVSPGVLAGFSLLDASGESEVSALNDGDVVVVDGLSGGRYLIGGNTYPDADVGSVRLVLRGMLQSSQVANAGPYLLNGDGSGLTLPTGGYALQATAYADADGGGDTLGVRAISFELQDRLSRPEIHSVKALDREGMFEVDWHNVKGATSYELETFYLETTWVRLPDAELNLDANFNGSEAVVDGLGDRHPYWFRARAVSGHKKSEWSQPYIFVVALVPDGACPGLGHYPMPVEVEAVPIVVESTTEEYFVLFVQPDLDSDREFLASVTLGQDGTTPLTEQLSPLPAEHYRVEKYSIALPADVDGDCIDDITELGDPVGMNPLNPAPAIDLQYGAVIIPDRQTFETLSSRRWRFPIGTHQQQPDVMHFYVIGTNTGRPAVYFQNTETFLSHPPFRWAIDLYSNPLYNQGRILGHLVYYPNAVAPDGSLGVYSIKFDIYDNQPFEEVAYAYEALAASMPLLDNNLAYYAVAEFRLHFNPLVGYRIHERYLRERALYEDSRVTLLFDEDIFPDVDFLPLNLNEGYGFLRVMSPEERPNPRDIVIYETLPNELSRVAGIITTVPQTPLSHVNLRAVQDGVPNAFIRDALDDDDIEDLIGTYIYYRVDVDGWTLLAATPSDIKAYYAASRPSETQTPERDLTVTGITGLADIGFGGWSAFGVKAANVAVLRTLGFPEGTVPDGFAVPFYFYDEFMKHNEFYDDIEELLADPEFQSDFDTQEKKLKKLRKKIKKGETPEWIKTALTDMHATYPEGQSLRYRSSTNNEDLPGFSGAGLYDSKTQHPEETEEDGIAKSLKQVYASLWNFRAFTEREIHRIDHLAAAMGVLVHPNYSDELANGVAVSFDPLYGTQGSYYVNTQFGEDLVTNPDAHSVPEEILLQQSGSTYDVLAYSNQTPQGQLLMSDAQMDQLRRHLAVIHDEFAGLYGIEAGEPFAMEIEFKITSANILAIKQARPWVFSDAADARPNPNTPATGEPTIGGTAQVGETLTADTSAIDDGNGLIYAPAFSYQWLADGVDILGATDSAYTLVVADLGKAIQVRVSFTDEGSYDETLTSAATAAAVARPNTPATGKPTVRDSPGGRDADSGHVGHRRPGRSGKRRVQLPVGQEQRIEGDGHRGRHRLRLHLGGRRSGKGHQGPGVLH